VAISSFSTCEIFGVAGATYQNEVQINDRLKFKKIK